MSDEAQNVDPVEAGENKGEEGDKLLDEKKEEPEGDAAEETADEDEIKYIDTKCCCCICQCSREETQDLGCCGCFPIKCGVVTIGVFLLALCLVLFFELFYCLLSDYIHWWYTFVAAILFAPLIIGTFFFVVFFTDDTESTRGRLFVSCQLIIISLTLVCIWNICYFFYLYKEDTVTIGNGSVGYYKKPKKAFIVENIFITAALDFIFAYFLCVCRTYHKALGGKEEEGSGFSIGGFGKKDEKKDDDAKPAEDKKD